MQSYFDTFLKKVDFKQWREPLSEALKARANPQRHGKLPDWLNILEALPTITTSHITLDQDAICIGRETDLTPTQLRDLKEGLKKLMPWRKGPYQLFDIYVDTEWRSDWKWQRLAPHLNSLEGHKVLDVGCGNGYHCWRMLGSGADYVLGIDPSMLFNIQFLTVQRYAKNSKIDFLPLGIEDMPEDMSIFDSVFSMGVLYHRRNPIKHLLELKRLLKPHNGQLILETLIVDHAQGGILTPKERYAQMRNVWSIMTIDKITKLLTEAGFKKIRCIDQTVTSTNEQRATDWMNFQSLTDFLDPKDNNKTIEGYPAPKRAIFIAST